MNNNRSRASFAFLTLASLAAFAGCQAGYVQVSSSYGPGITFQGLGSKYAWATPVAAPASYPAGLADLIEKKLSAGLAKKGFSLVGPGETADFLVAYRVTRKEKADSTINPHIEMTKVGSLIVEVYEVGTKKLIWRGVATSQLEDSDTPDRRSAKVEEGVRLLMTKFPSRLPPKTPNR